jgi:hypothetical protein
VPFIRPERFPQVPVAVDPSPVLVPDFEPFATHAGWRAGWTHVRPGSFSASAFSGLFCYDQNQGAAAFYETDGLGNLRVLAEYDDWGTSWTHVVVGKFAQGPYSALLLYDQSAGSAAFYATDGQGGMTLLWEGDWWRTSWTTIVAGHFSSESDYDGVLLYDRSAGFGAFYSTDGQGGLDLLSENDGWRTSWTGIVVGEWGVDRMQWDQDYEPNFADLFFYEGETGYGETYVCDGSGGILQVGGQSGLPVDARVVAGSFGGLYWMPWTNLIFLDPELRHGQVWAGNGYPVRDPPADPVHVHDHRPWRPDANSLQWFPNETLDLVGPGYDVVAPGNFWVADSEDLNFPGGGFTDLAFYRSADGDLDFFLKEPPAASLDLLAGYASATSVRPGELISFHISSNAGPFEVSVYRLGASERHMATLAVAPISPGPHPIPRNAWRDGAAWPAASTVRIPSTWPSGLYVARVRAGALTPGVGGILEARVSGVGGVAPTTTYDVPFVVRSPWPGHTASILVGVPDTTYEAYNYWGGRCLYTGSAGDGVVWVAPYGLLAAPRALRVSFRRGFRSLDQRAGTDHKMQVWEVPFLAWLEQHGIAVDLCAMSDLHHNASLLDGYQLFVSVGHDEYWSQEMRSSVESFVAAGGNAAFLSGNTCYWQVRFEDDGGRMICYKDAALDPIAQSEPARTTVQWPDPPVSNPERKLTGVRDANLFDPETITFPGEPYTVRQYTVTNADHWVFANTGLEDGGVFGLYVRPDGEVRTALGHETDVRGPETPDTFTTLAEMRNNEGAVLATMVIDEGGAETGTVFSAATCDWVLGLNSVEIYQEMSQMTLNILQRLGRS